MVEEQVAQGDRRPNDADAEHSPSKKAKLEQPKDVESEPKVNLESTNEVASEPKNDSDKPSQGVELKDKITKQIEYYFSDVNLMKDKFMLEQLKKNDNSVSLSVLATFSRLAQLTKDENVIIEALKDHESEYMELDAEKKIIRRKKPIPDREEFLKELDTRTVHISDFPDTVKFDDLHRFCSRFGEIESLSMRHHFKTKQFKGCIHVVFKNEADAKKVIEGEKPMFKDRELRRESMEQYHKRKEDIKRHRLEKRNSKK